MTKEETLKEIAALDARINAAVAGSPVPVNLAKFPFGWWFLAAGLFLWTFFGGLVHATFIPSDAWARSSQWTFLAAWVVVAVALLATLRWTMKRVRRRRAARRFHDASGEIQRLQHERQELQVRLRSMPD